VSDRPVLRIVAGGVATDEEIAALTAVVTALQARRAPDPESPRARWLRAGWLASARRSSLRQPQ
jgi:hypothetical protein